MKFSYKLSNLLGASYKRGNVVFTSDGNSLISAVSNKINVYDLKNDKVSTLPIESRFNYVALDLSPNGCVLVAINEEGEAHMISLISQIIVHSYRFKGKVRCVKFSPDGKHFAVCKENNVFVFRAPHQFSGQYNPFIMERVFHTATDETTCLSWSFDSRLLAVGSKDMTVRVHSMDKFSNFKILALRNHTDSIVGCFFEKESYDIITLSKNGQMCIWECNLNPDDLVPISQPTKKMKIQPEEEMEDNIDELKAIESSDADISKALRQTNEESDELINDGIVEPSERFHYKKLDRHYLADEPRKDDKEAILTSVDYHSTLKIVIVGFSNGSFYMYEMPHVSLIDSLNISSGKVATLSFNGSGDWVAFGCSGVGQLIVWEWQSQTFILKQQSHATNTSCVSYSIDGEIVASGGEDGKVKLWNVTSGSCFKTFNEHSSAVTAVDFSGNKKFVVSASLDGTVRAYDVLRYRNFRTFTGTRPAQFMSVAVDCSGEFVAAGAQDLFEIYLWSVKTGKLVDVLSGHTGPVGSLDFAPLLTSTLLVSASWDKTIRIWDAIENSSAHESLELTSDAICVVFNPKGHEVAVATLNGQIHFFDVKHASQTGTIEGKRDLGSGRSDTDVITAKKSQEAKAFTTLCYSADGEYILAGGQSKNICIYHIKGRLLVKKFEVTQNRSLDAMDDFINRRKLTEFGNLSLIEEREEREGGNVAIRLPGVKKGDMAARVHKPEVRVWFLQFSPTGQQWAAATTEGILVYSLNMGMTFDPWNLELGVTPSLVKKCLKSEEFSEALTMSLKLNEPKLVMEVMEKVPWKNVELVVSSIPVQYIEKIFMFLAEFLESSNHLQFYLIWIHHLVYKHGSLIQNKTAHPAVVSIRRVLNRKYTDLCKITDYNIFSAKVINSQEEVVQEQSLQNEDSDLEYENLMEVEC